MVRTVAYPAAEGVKSVWPSQLNKMRVSAADSCDDLRVQRV
jgi:hypothetical protein